VFHLLVARLGLALDRIPLTGPLIVTTKAFGRRATIRRPDAGPDMPPVGLAGQSSAESQPACLNGRL
jgi:hypothetical protein